ncbi:MAG: hypothetical protein A2Y82_04915 [Candidatus Buchananbacteria bacterium RBG_13_36_9]|uniref:Uncharacterized protein n=1 Tax=Candidatus Buchananbacteria bacterium RBG_13_36_9 TaxID=1797530 RepID=A0A1G1XQU8_9BACT|nr:MAG: hypothetical protein A2Y82_04915 [Candidatus Buchananbacteria bacterium RBG_13_36_9]
MICRPADPKDNLNQGIEIYTLGGKKYVDLGLSENKADAVKKAGELKFKTLRMAKIDFADPNNLTAKGQHKLICWEFICDK